MVDKIEVRGAIPAAVIEAAQVLMKWNVERVAAVQAAEPDAKLFSMSSLGAPDGTLFVVCGPEHSHCLREWFDAHRSGPDAEHGVAEPVDDDDDDDESRTPA